MGQPRSSCTWRDLGGATRLPGAGDLRTFGGCRPGACSACHRDHPFDRRTAARRAGARRLAGRASSRHRHPLPNMQDKKAGHTAKTRAVCQVPEDTMTEKSERLPRPPPHHTRRSQGRLERRRAPGHRIAAGFVHTRRKRLSFPRFPRLMCSGFPGAGCWILVMLRAGSGWLEVRIRSG